MQFTKLHERRLCCYNTNNCWRSYIAATVQLLVPVWPEAWSQTPDNGPATPTKESMNVLGNAQPEETCLKKPVSHNMEPQSR